MGIDEESLDVSSPRSLDSGENPISSGLLAINKNDGNTPIARVYIPNVPHAMRQFQPIIIICIRMGKPARPIE